MKCQFKKSLCHSECILNRGHVGNHIVIYESDEYEGQISFLIFDDDNNMIGGLSNEEIMDMIRKSVMII